MPIPNTDWFISFETVQRVTRTRRGLDLQVDTERCSIDFIHADVVRLKISNAGGTFDTRPTFAVMQDEFGATPLVYSEDADTVRVRSTAIEVVVRLKPFDFEVRRTDGTPLHARGEGASYRFLNNTWSLRRRRTAGDAFLGLGEKTGAANHAGRSLQMWNTDILAPSVDGEVRDNRSADPLVNPTSDQFDPYYISIPLYYHLPEGRPDLASASFIDNGYRLHYELSRDQELEICGEGGQYTEYLFAGPTIQQILSRYTELTGRIQPPPLWSLGHHQCRWKDYTDAEWLRLAQEYRERRLPCDVLWLDIGYMDGFRVFTWHPERFPDIDANLATIREQGFRAITIIDPGVKYEPGYPVFDEGLERNLFCRTEGGQVYIGQVWPGRTAFPDFVQEEARQWWGRLNAEHVARGFAGIWNDMNEPATGAVSPLPMRFDQGGANHPHERYHNQYGMLMAMGTLEGLQHAHPGMRSFILSRAGFAGIQRYAANWTGDNISCWEHLAMSVTMNCKLGISGQPFVGSDIGGFAGNSSEELLVRWYQYGAFQPFMRNHNCAGHIDQYPWSFGAAAEGHIRQALELRYRLLPYTYTWFMHAAATGEPISRPLVYAYQNDPAVRDASHEFLYGPDLFVAPVIAAGQTERTCYVPQGTWYCYHSGQTLDGGQTLCLPAPADRIPVLVRAGAVLPEVEPVQSTMHYAPETLTLKIYPPTADGVHTTHLYEDDGLTQRHIHGAYLRTTLRLERRGQRLTLTGTVEGDGFAGFNRQRLRLQCLKDGSWQSQELSNQGGAFEASFTV